MRVTPAQYPGRKHLQEGATSLLQNALLLFWAFFKVGVLGYGGGPGSIGLIQSVVTDAGWVSPNQFAEILGVANALPGPIATKLAGYLGYRVAGIVGMVAALLGVILPSLIVLVVLYRFLQLHRNDPIVKGIIRGVGPVVIAILAVLVLNLMPASLKGWKEIAVLAGAFLLIRFAGLPEPLVILGGMLAGALFLR